MDINAAPFVPKPRSPTARMPPSYSDATAGMATSSSSKPVTPTSQGPANPAMLKLRADAASFVPRSMSSPGSSSQEASPTKATVGELPAAASAAAAAAATAANVAGAPVRLSPNAAPYTPTQARTPTNATAPAFPASPQPASSASASPSGPVSAQAAAPVAAPAAPVVPVESLPATADWLRAASRVAIEPPETPLATTTADDLKLSSTWILYADETIVQLGGGGDQTAFNPSTIASIADVPTMWRTLKGVPLPSTRVPSFTYYLFRRAINPSWEDPRNKNGGFLSIVLHDTQRVGMSDKQCVDDAWVLAVLAVLGESLPETSNVNGITLKVRRATTLNIWTGVASRPQLQALADGIRQVLLPVAPKAVEKIEFYSHAPVSTPTTKSKAKVAARAKAPDFEF